MPTSDTVTLAIPMSAEEYDRLRGGRHQHLQGTKLQRYVAKHALLTGSLAFLLSSFVRQGLGETVEALFSPLQNVDLNADGVSDMAQVARWQLELGGGLGALPCGRIAVELAKNAFGAALTICIVYLLLERTSWLDADVA